MLAMTPESPARTHPPALNMGLCCSSMLYPSGSPAGAVRVQQKDGEDNSFCRNLKGILVRHLHHGRSTSNLLPWGFEPNSLLLCGILPNCKTALKFCPSGESGGQQRGPGKSHGDQPRVTDVPRNTAAYVGTCPRQGWVEQGPGIG